MRVLFVSREYPPFRSGGIGAYVASITAALAARGHDVHVLSCWPDQKNSDYSDRGVHVHRRQGISTRGLRRVGRRIPKTVEVYLAGLSTYRAYGRLRHCFDVVEYPDIAAEGWVLALRRSQPLVAHLHCPMALWCQLNERPLTSDIKSASMLERFAVRRAHIVTSPSRLLVSELKNMGWLPQVEPLIIPHPVDWFPSTRRCSILNTPPTVLFMNRLERNKAPELLIQAIAVLRKTIPEAKAVFVGAARKRTDGASYLEWMRANEQCLAACEFVGEVSRDELQDFISRSRVVAIPSWFESYSMSAIEAMSFGRPVVVTSTSGVSELIEEAKAGRIIPPGDSNALARALEPFLLDASYAGMVGQLGQECLRRYLAPDIIATQRERVYQMAIDVSKGRASIVKMDTQCDATH